MQSTPNLNDAIEALYAATLKYLQEAWDNPDFNWDTPEGEMFLSLHAANRRYEQYRLKDKQEDRDALIAFRTEMLNKYAEVDFT